jgi:plasmid stabilization system protein ParE
MTPIVWSEAARQDLREIHAYIARDSSKYALRVIERIKTAAENARLFPQAGAIVPEWGREDVREVFSGPYRIIYQVGADLLVLTVIHGARMLLPR